MKLFSIFSLAPLAAAMAVGLATPAQANDMCFYEDGFQVCITNLALTTGGFDSLTVRGPGVNEKMNIQCRDSRVTDWNSYGNMSQSDAHEAAVEFCSGRGTTGRGY